LTFGYNQLYPGRWKAIQLFHIGVDVVLTPQLCEQKIEEGLDRMVTLTLNTAARSQDKFSANSKIRAKIQDGVMFIRPTARKAPVNLPKTERLVDMASNGKVEIEGIELGAGTYGLTAEKYGWFALTPGHTGRGPSAKVA